MSERKHKLHEVWFPDSNPQCSYCGSPLPRSSEIMQTTSRSNSGSVPTVSRNNTIHQP